MDGVSRGLTACISEMTPETCAAAMLVPITPRMMLSLAAAMVPLSNVVSTVSDGGDCTPPGALTVSAGPVLAYVGRPPSRFTAPTVITLLQLPGLKLPADCDRLPAAATTIAPRAMAASMAP